MIWLALSQLSTNSAFFKGGLRFDWFVNLGLWCKSLSWYGWIAVAKMKKLPKFIFLLGLLILPFSTDTLNEAQHLFSNFIREGKKTRMNIINAATEKRARWSGPPKYNAYTIRQLYWKTFSNSVIQKINCWEFEQAETTIPLTEWILTVKERNCQI